MFYIIKLILIPVISGLIGWITNKIAIWMLFNPKDPVRFLFWTFQGVFPKRQNAIAQRIGDLVADELLSVESVKQQIFTDENQAGIVNFVLEKVDLYLNTEFKEDHWFLNLLLGENTKIKMKSELERKLYDSLDDISGNFHDYMENKVGIRKLVADRINSLDPGQVNQLMNHILKTELGFIEISGGVLGFIIGLIQLLIMHFI